MQRKKGILPTNLKILITFKDLQSEFAHGDVDMLPTPIIVPLNLLSGASSPSNLILNLIPTDILLFLASRYLLALTTNSD
jgi:hypothetical protein